MDLAMAQAVSRLLPTSVARAALKVKSCGICGGQSGTRACFLPVRWFPPVILHSTNCSIFIIHPIIEATASLNKQLIKN
jgi:hypothetical protein